MISNCSNSIYILTDGIDDASGIDNNTVKDTVLKIPIEATEDACSAIVLL